MTYFAKMNKSVKSKIFSDNERDDFIAPLSIWWVAFGKNFE
jgi:hypothetical protein